MKIKFAYSLACLVLVIFSSSSFAQKERLDDLVPFKKGKKWGIVHHDGKEFYPPKLDSVLLSINIEQKYSVFITEDNQQRAKVIMDGKSMFLSPLKKLEPASYSFSEVPPGTYEDSKIDVVNQEGIKDDGEMFSRKYLTAKQNNKVDIRGSAYSGFHFFINDKEVAEFECNYYNLTTNKQEQIIGAVLRNNQKWAYANLETGKLDVPFEYTDIRYCAINPNWFIVSKDGYKGIITNTNKPVTTLRYSYLQPLDYYDKSNSLKPVVASYAKSGDYFFLFPETNRGSNIKYDLLYQCFSGNGPDPVFFVKKDGKAGIITATDKIIVPIKYDDIECVVPRFSFLVANEKTGFLDFYNRYYRKEPTYDYLSQPIAMNFTKNGLSYVLFYVTKNGQSFYVDNYGKEFMGK